MSSYRSLFRSLLAAIVLATVGWAQSDGPSPLPDPVASAYFGGVRITPATSELGVQPFHLRDVDGDGRDDLGIPWSEGDMPVRMDFTLADPDALIPTSVIMTLRTADAVATAYDANLNEIAIIAATGPEGIQAITVHNAGGIAFIDLDTTHSYVTDICWSTGQADTPQFVRGDLDGSGGVNIGDGIAILNYLFNEGVAPCQSAADVDDSGTTNIADAIFVLLFLFQGGTAPAAPFPSCGDDPTPDALDCTSQLLCPSSDPGTEVCSDTATVTSSDGQPMIQLRSGALTPPAGVDALGIAQTVSGNDVVYFLLQLEPGTSLTNAIIDELEGLDVISIDFLGGADANQGEAYLVSAYGSAPLGLLAGVDEIYWAGPIEPLFKLAPELQSNNPAAAAPWIMSGDQAGLTIYLQAEAPFEAFGSFLDEVGATILAPVSFARAYQITIHPSAIAALAQEPDILFIEPIGIPLEGLNDQARLEHRVEPLRDFPYSLTGSGVTALVYDNGNIDSGHPDFDDRIIEVESPLEGSSAHATHVAGTIGGTGIQSHVGGGVPRQFEGMAPEVEIRSFSFGLHINFFDNPDDLVENSRRSSPTDLVNLSVGNKVVENGRDCSQLGEYTLSARAVDTVVLGIPNDPLDPPEPRIPVISAAGNERGSEAPCGEFGTIASPATAKNSIVVGATLTGTDDSYFSSSYGPTRDGRLKPDLVASGFIGSTDLGNGYSFQSGTSVSTPIVSGIAALMIEEWRWLRTIDEGVFPPFSPRTIKAVLLHTAQDLGLDGPDYKFGFGRADAQAAIELLRSDYFEEESTGRVIYQGLVDTGVCYLNEFETTSTAPQKFTLVWDDPRSSPMAVSTLVNDLDLTVTDPAGNIYHPLRPDPENPELAATEGDDRVNNVEQVRAPGMAGIWTFEVVAQRMGGLNAQAFTLVREPSVEIETCSQQVRKTIEFIPPWTDGDRDFDGNGPDMFTEVFLEVRDLNELWMRMSIEATETVADFTKAEGEQEHLVFYDPDVQQIILTSPDYDGGGLDGTGYVNVGLSGVIRDLFFYGDRNGIEAGTYTRVRMVSNPIEFDCIPAGFTSSKRVIEVDPIRFQPPQVGEGDADFDGHGPEVEVTVDLSIGGEMGQQIVATVTMDALEVGGDGTRAMGSETFVLYEHSSPIASIDSAASDSASYTDIDWQVDRLPVGGGCAREFVVVGDTNGSEAGTRTAVTIDFNPIRFTELP